jgi:hypothetical protein
MDGVEGATLNTTQRDAIAENRSDRRRSLGALHDLESFASAAAPGREQDWTNNVSDALRVLDFAISRQGRRSDESDSPLSDIEATEPRLRNRVVQLRRRYSDLEQRVGELRAHIDSMGTEPGDVNDIRRRLEAVATELRYLQAREADLVYEAYAVDLGGGD